jgi:hypothetical protein
MVETRAQVLRQAVNHSARRQEAVTDAVAILRSGQRPNGSPHGLRLVPSASPRPALERGHVLLVEIDLNRARHDD